MLVLKVDLLAALRARFLLLTRILFSADLLLAKPIHLLRQIYPVIIPLE